MLRKNLSILSLLSLTFVSISIFAMTPKTKKSITTNGINSVPYSRYFQYHRMFPGLVPTLPFQKREYSQNPKKRNFMNNQCSYKKTIKKVGMVGLIVGLLGLRVCPWLHAKWRCYDVSKHPECYERETIICSVGYLEILISSLKKVKSDDKGKIRLLNGLSTDNQKFHRKEREINRILKNNPDIVNRSLSNNPDIVNSPLKNNLDFKNLWEILKENRKVVIFTRLKNREGV